MKTRIIPVVLVTILGFVRCAAVPTARSLKQCPSGHAALKNVPLIYGLPPSEGKDAEEWQRDVSNLSFIPGGCVRTPDSPKHAVVCTTCRFTYSVLSTEEPEGGAWHRTASDPTSFALPLSDLVLSFPIPVSSPVQRPAEYTQSLTNSLAVKFEHISYETTQPLEELIAEIDGWLRDNHIKTHLRRRPFETMTGMSRGVLTWESSEAATSIDLHYDHADKTSFVFATVDPENSTGTTSDLSRVAPQVKRNDH